MQHKKWMPAVVLAAMLSLTALFAPERLSAQPPWCVYPVVLTCRGVSVTGMWETGHVGCDAGNQCRCPLPASQYDLLYNMCAGQAP